MREIGRGRTSVIYDLGDGAVLRLGGEPAREAAAMRHARRYGFPVPEVLEQRQDGLVLERIEGDTMSALLRRRPTQLETQMLLLASLHERLHAIPAMNGEGQLLHLDLHPANVILSPSGPVVIDWTNAGRGDPALDRALSYVILATSAGEAGRLCAEVFARYADIKSRLSAAAAYRVADPHISDDEREAVNRLLAIS